MKFKSLLLVTLLIISYSSYSERLCFKPFNNYNKVEINFDSIVITNITQNYTITAYDKCVDPDSIRLKVVDPKKNSKSEGIKLSNYPNCFENETQIDLSISKNSIVSLCIYDILGRNIIKQNINLNAGYYTFLLDASSLSPGSYYILASCREYQQVLNICKTSPARGSYLNISLIDKLPKSDIELEYGNSYNILVYAKGYAEGKLFIDSAINNKVYDIKMYLLKVYNITQGSFEMDSIGFIVDDYQYYSHPNGSNFESHNIYNDLMRKFSYPLSTFQPEIISPEYGYYYCYPESIDFAVLDFCNHYGEYKSLFSKYDLKQYSILSEIIIDTSNNLITSITINNGIYSDVSDYSQSYVVHNVGHTYIKIILENLPYEISDGKLKVFIQGLQLKNLLKSIVSTYDEDLEGSPAEGRSHNYITGIYAFHDNSYIKLELW